MLSFVVALDLARMQPNKELKQLLQITRQRERESFIINWTLWLWVVWLFWSGLIWHHQPSATTEYWQTINQSLPSLYRYAWTCVGSTFRGLEQIARKVDPVKIENDTSMFVKSRHSAWRTKQWADVPGTFWFDKSVTTNVVWGGT